MPEQQPDHRRYEQAKDILQRALDLTPGARSAYLQAACGDDAALRAEVDSLLGAHNDVHSGFLDRPLAFLRDDGDSEDIDLTGKRIGAYRLERLLGRGGMGAVYLASRADGEFSKHVAIKFIRTSRVSPAALKRFKAERQILADIDHPNIARLIDGGTAEGMPFFIMEYVPGDTLAQAIDRGALPLARVTRLALGVAEVLEAIHAKGLVFRDLKPSNIILNEETGVKVLDFGIAKLMQPDTGEETTRSTLTGAGLIIGSPRYMSPEQAAGEAVDARSDIFSFGLVMFEALTGRLPFTGRSRKEYFKNLAADDAEGLPPEVPPRLRAIIERCLKKDPADRFRSGHELADAVRAMATPVARFFGGRASWVALLIFALAVGAFGVWTSQRPRASDAPQLKGPPQPIATWASSETNPRFSPDLKWLSFISDRGGSPKILLRNRQSGEERTFEPAGGDVWSHEWSPASDRIAYLVRYGAASGLAIESIADGKIVVHPLPHKNVVLVRWIGNSVYYLVEGSLWRFDLAGDRPTEVTTARGPLWLRNVDVTPDEKRIVFSAITETVSSIFSAAIDGSAAVRLTTDRIDPKYPRLKSGRGQQLLYVSEEGGMIDIWQLDVATRKRQQLTFTTAREGRFDVSSDGATLVYEQIREDAHVTTLDPAAPKPAMKVLTSDSLGDLLPHASSSGRDVVFQRSTSIDMALGPTNATVRFSRDGFKKEPEILAQGYAPEISPDGRWVAYSVWKPKGVAELWLIDVVNRQPVRVSEDLVRFGYTGYPYARITSNVAWSGTGPTLYFLARKASGGVEVWMAAPPAPGDAVRVQQPQVQQPIHV
jgi:serine/threonine protein kinase